MPELPEVETVRRTLTPAIGAEILGVWDSAQGLHMKRKPPRAALKKLVGRHITGVRRHGKYLLVDTDGPSSLLVHLGMTDLVLDLGERELRFSDPRRFGQLDVVTRATERAHPALAVLGPDPIVDGIDVAAFHARAKGKKAQMKAFVLDQSVLAGVGNIYASEALWRAKIRPTTRAHRLTLDRATVLAAAILEVLNLSLEKGGTTLSDFVDAAGYAGANAEYLWVYDRKGEPCPRCKTPIKRTVLQGRATYFCPTCQTP